MELRSCMITVIWVLPTILQCVRTELSTYWIADCSTSVNRTKDCFRGPPECKELSLDNANGESCDVVLIWQQTYDQQSINFEVYAPVSNDLDYVAIAFSPNQKMSDSDVLACFSIEGTTHVTHSYNTINHVNEQEELIGVSEVSGSIHNGILNCNFTRIKFKEGQSHFHDLRNDFYILAARGKQLDGRIAYHTIGRYISEDKFNFDLFTAEPGPTTAQSIHVMSTEPIPKTTQLHNKPNDKTKETTAKRGEQQDLHGNGAALVTCTLALVSTALMTCIAIMN